MDYQSVDHRSVIICNVGYFILHYQGICCIGAHFQETFKIRNVYNGINIAEKWPNSDHTINRTTLYLAAIM